MTTFDKQIALIKTHFGLELKENQIPHFKRLVDYAQQSLCLIDKSATGSGKSFVTTALVLYYGFKPLVITTKSTVPMWTNLFKKYKIEPVDILTYQSLASRKGSQPKHGLLTRFDDPSKERNALSFTLTAKGKKLAKRCLIIFDEGQNMKNDSAQSLACLALARGVWGLINGPTTSRVITLSASLFDKEDNAIQFMKVFGYMSHYSMLYQIRDKEFKPLGISEIIASAKAFDSEATENIVDEMGLNDKTVKKITFRLLTEVILPRMSSRMDPSISDYQAFVFNGFFRMEEKEAKIYQKAVKALQNLVVFESVKGKDQVNFSSRSNIMSQITPIIMNLETAKLPIIKRLTHRFLEENTKNKIIVSLNFIESIEVISDEFEDYNPLILTGNKTAKAREKIIDSFNNDKDSRLLICTPATGGIGVSLHDLKGDAPRKMLLVPTYNMVQTILQPVGRIDREGKKSDSEVYVVYGPRSDQVGEAKEVKEGDDVTEKRIFEAIVRKSKVLHDVNSDENEVLPGDYEIYIEPEDAYAKDKKRRK